MPRNSIKWETPPKVNSDHYVNADVYTDARIFRDEMKNIFEATWQFACHVSEIPEVGDYRVLTVARRSVIVIRDETGDVRCLLNTCSHRSSKILEEPAGNAKRLVCPFHLWTFDTKGRCVERTRECGYDQTGPSIDKVGLRVLRSEVCYGMVFVNLDDTAPSLDEYVGNSWDIVKDVLGGSELEVFHYHRFVFDANWKQWQETNMELYHEWGHPVNRRTSIMAPGYHDRTWEVHQNGHGWLTPFVVQYTNYKGWKQRADKPLPGLVPNEYRILDLFPNTTIHIRATTLRVDVATPLGPNKTLVEFRGLGVKDESAEDRAMRQNHHNQFWGPFGRNLPEDIRFVEKVSLNNQSGAAKYAIFARHENMRTQDDEVIRAYYRTWARYMSRSASDPLSNTSE